MRRLVRALRLLRDRARLRRSALFDPLWYLDSYPDLHSAKRLGRPRAMDPAWHYLAHGADEGRDPGPLFSTSGYRLQTDPGPANPLLHHETQAGAGLALPVFAGTGPLPPPAAPVVLFFAHQALGQQFGAERSFLHMLDRAARAGLAVEVVLPQCLDAGYLALVRDRARRVHILPCPWRRAGRLPHPATLAAMAALIRSSGAVEVHQNTVVLDAPLIAACHAGVPSVVHIRELPDQDAELCARLALTPDRLRADLLAQADRFIANSEATTRWIDPAGALPPDRLVVLPNAVDPALAALPFAPADPLRVGLIGSNTAKKGIADVLAVARISAGLGLRAEFALIGPATADLAALGPLPANLHHAGYAATPLGAMAQVDVVLSLSRFAESFGRTVLEALTAGRPVICYDRGTPPALLGESGAGAVVRPDDPQAVAEALAHLLQDQGRLMAASQAARARAGALATLADAVPDSRLYAAAQGAGPGRLA
jgi:glycosyltransferase involved in cell wall biosynthesis